MNSRTSQPRRGTAPDPSRDAANPPGPRAILLGILAFAAASRLLYLLAYLSDPFARHLLHDARRYHAWAETLARGASFEPGPFYQAPLYPYLVSLVYRLTGPQPVAVYALQSLLGVLTVLLVFRIARRAYGATPALLGAVLAALYAPAVFLEAKLLPAALAVFLAALAVDRLQSADDARGDAAWLQPGIALGLAAINAASFLAALPLVLAWLAADRSRPAPRRALRAGWLALGAGLVLLPVVAHNHRASGEWIAVATNGGVTFYQGNNPNAVGVYSTPPGLPPSIFEQRERSRALAREQTGRALGEGEASAWYFARGLAFLAEDPPRALRLLGRKLSLSLASEEQPLEYNARLDRNPFRRLTPLPFAALLALAALRPFSRRRGPARAEHAILLPIVVTAATLLAFYVSGRYRMPALPSLAALAGAGAAALLDAGRERPRRAWGLAALALIVAGASLAWVPLVRGELREQQEAMSWLDRASALRASGRGDGAIEAVRRSLELDPVFAERRLYLARLLDEAGDLDGAAREAREALRLDPDADEARFLLGVVAVRAGRLDEAADAFAELVRRDPDHPGATNNLLGVLIELGRTDEAAEVRDGMRRRGVEVDPGLDARLGPSQPKEP